MTQEQRFLVCRRKGFPGDEMQRQYVDLLYHHHVDLRREKCIRLIRAGTRQANGACSKSMKFGNNTPHFRGSWAEFQPYWLELSALYFHFHPPPPFFSTFFLFPGESHCCWLSLWNAVFQGPVWQLGVCPYILNAPRRKKHEQQWRTELYYW